jgi:hypothetical protein
MVWHPAESVLPKDPMWILNVLLRSCTPLMSAWLNAPPQTLRPRARQRPELQDTGPPTVRRTIEGVLYHLGLAGPDLLQSLQRLGAAPLVEECGHRIGLRFNVEFYVPVHSTLRR